MNYTDFHFMMKDIEKNPKGFFLIILVILILALLLIFAFHKWNSFQKEKRDAMVIVFREYVLPQVLSQPTAENLDKAILDTIQLLKLENNPSYKEMETMRQNYQTFLAYNNKSCVLEEQGEKNSNPYFNGLDKQPRYGHYVVENPYLITLKNIKTILKSNHSENTYFFLPPTYKISYFCHP